MALNCILVSQIIQFVRLVHLRDAIRLCRLRIENLLFFSVNGVGELITEVQRGVGWA